MGLERSCSTGQLHILHRGEAMTEIQEAVLRAMLDILLERELVDRQTHDSAVGVLHTMADVPAFFRCKTDLRNADGYTQDS